MLFIDDEKDVDYEESVRIMQEEYESRKTKGRTSCFADDEFDDDEYHSKIKERKPDNESLTEYVIEQTTQKCLKVIAHVMPEAGIDAETGSIDMFGRNACRQNHTLFSLDTDIRLSNNETFFAQILDILYYKKGQKILIQAPCGSGKSYSLARIGRDIVGSKFVMVISFPTKLNAINFAQKYGASIFIEDMHDITVNKEFSVVASISDKAEDACTQVLEAGMIPIFVMDEAHEVSMLHESFRANSVNVNRETAEKLLGKGYNVLYVTATPAVLGCHRFSYIFEVAELTAKKINFAIAYYKKEKNIRIPQQYAAFCLQKLKEYSNKGIHDAKICIHLNNRKQIAETITELNAFGITALALTSDDYKNTGTTLDGKTYFLNPVMQQLYDNSTLPAFMPDGKPVSVYLFTSVINSGVSIDSFSDGKKYHVSMAYIIPEAKHMDMDSIVQFSNRVRDTAAYKDFTVVMPSEKSIISEKYKDFSFINTYQRYLIQTAYDGKAYEKLSGIIQKDSAYMMYLKGTDLEKIYRTENCASGEFSYMRAFLAAYSEFNKVCFHDINTFFQAMSEKFGWELSDAYTIFVSEIFSKHTEQFNNAQTSSKKSKTLQEQQSGLDKIQSCITSIADKCITESVNNMNTADITERQKKIISRIQDKIKKNEIQEMPELMQVRAENPAMYRKVRDRLIMGQDIEEQKENLQNASTVKSFRKKEFETLINYMRQAHRIPKFVRFCSEKDAGIFGVHYEYESRTRTVYDNKSMQNFTFTEKERVKVTSKSARECSQEEVVFFESLIAQSIGRSIRTLYLVGYTEEQVLEILLSSDTITEVVNKAEEGILTSRQAMIHDGMKMCGLEARTQQMLWIFLHKKQIEQQNHKDGKFFLDTRTIKYFIKQASGILTPMYGRNCVKFGLVYKILKQVYNMKEYHVNESGVRFTRYYLGREKMLRSQGAVMYHSDELLVI